MSAATAGRSEGLGIPELDDSSPFAPASPTDVTLALDELAAALRDAAGDKLLSLILYGGLARGRYHPGTSDINLVVVEAEPIPPRASYLARPLVFVLALRGAFFADDFFADAALAFGRDFAALAFGRDAAVDVFFGADVGAAAGAVAW